MSPEARNGLLWIGGILSTFVLGSLLMDCNPQQRDQAAGIMFECATPAVARAIQDALCGTKTPPAELAEQVAKCLGRKAASELEDVFCPVDAGQGDE